MPMDWGDAPERMEKMSERYKNLTAEEVDEIFEQAKEILIPYGLGIAIIAIYKERIGKGFSERRAQIYSLVFVEVSIDNLFNCEKDLLELFPNLKKPSIPRKTYYS
ncbi:hypothetical protein HF1_04970 [Mycoplasma haemofelis str. Langford 1]|uniref:Uncharacterized protein n=2 Tax=Mycoplasma haemofelis TaxID=29501 RepID=F6FHW8_MYCHI|nr:hypothetical protein [Mycoplasma haemofelis]AEG72816.1 hypothetical protein MHF_0544 [Mycoplasma haemofelis Ohio2]CBY92505.1 hypothetical protein HF1_04970 [Mycoplasma haemofelis str. Langford 1]